MTDSTRPADDPGVQRLDATVLRQRALRSLSTSFVTALSGTRRVVTLLLLVAAWCSLWGSFSVANVLAGFIIGVVVLTVGFGGRSSGGLRFVPLVKLTGLVALDMVTSTFSVMREVLTPTDYTEEGIIAVDLPRGAASHLLLLYVAITVTPGTAVVAAEDDGRRIYLHVLHLDRRAAIEEHVVELSDLAVRALPDRTDESVVVPRRDGGGS